MPCHASPYFAKTVSDVYTATNINTFPPQVPHSFGENNSVMNSQSESDLVHIIVKKIKEELRLK